MERMSKMAKLVYIPQDIDPSGKKLLLEHGFELKIGKNAYDESLKEGIIDSDAVIIRTGNFTRDILSRGNKLKMIARHGIGVNNIDLDYCQENGITVANDPYSNVNSVAEHILMLLLTLSKNTCYFHSNVKLLNYDSRKEIKNIELAGKTLGIIGYGKIGRLVARKAKYGLDMKVKMGFASPETTIPQTSFRNKAMDMGIPF